MTSSVTSNIENAEQIVHAYGELLSDLNEVGTAYPLSLLPHDKDFIRQAIITLLWEVDGMAADVRAGLTSGYVYLEQFIPDRQYAALVKGQTAVQSGNLNHSDWFFADEASTIMVQIKAAMENALVEMRLFSPK